MATLTLKKKTSKDKRIVIQENETQPVHEIYIMKIMSRATTPQSGWHIYQKMKRIVKNANDGDYILGLMMGLVEKGYLKRVDSDEQLGYLFKIEKNR